MGASAWSDSRIRAGGGLDMGCEAVGFEDVPQGLFEYFGAAPKSVRVIEPAGRLGDMTPGFGAIGAQVQREVCYPSRV